MVTVLQCHKTAHIERVLNRHFSAQRKHLFRDTLGGVSVSVSKLAEGELQGVREVSVHAAKSTPSPANDSNLSASS